MLIRRVLLVERERLSRATICPHEHNISAYAIIVAVALQILRAHIWRRNVIDGAYSLEVGFTFGVGAANFLDDGNKGEVATLTGR